MTTIPSFNTKKDYEIHTRAQAANGNQYGEIWTRVRPIGSDPKPTKAVGFADLKKASRQIIDWNGVQAQERHIKLKVALIDKAQKLTITANGQKQVFNLPSKQAAGFDDNVDGTIELEFKQSTVEGHSQPIWVMKDSRKHPESKKVTSQEVAAANSNFIEAFRTLNTRGNIGKVTPLFKPRGLPNPNNHCCINTPLVALAMNPGIQEAIKASREALEKHGDDAKKQAQISSALDHLANILKHIKGEESFDDKSLKQLLNDFYTKLQTAFSEVNDKPFEHLNDEKQHDAFLEFLQPLLRNLLREVYGEIQIKASEAESPSKKSLQDLLTNKALNGPKENKESLVVFFNRGAGKQKNHRSKHQLKLPENGQLEIDGQTYRIEAIGLHEPGQGKKEDGDLETMTGHYTCWVPNPEGDKLTTGTHFNDDNLSNRIDHTTLEKNVTFLTLKKVS